MHKVTQGFNSYIYIKIFIEYSNSCCKLFFEISVLYVLVGSLRDTQPCYKAPGGLQVENARNAVINIG